MQPDRFTTARNWLAAAGDDYTVATLALLQVPSLACFHAQQCAEKALKAILVAVAGDVAREHLMTRLLEELDGLGIETEDLRADALALEKFYGPTRYPDALGGANPGTAYTVSEARDAIARAERLIARARDLVAHENEADRGRTEDPS